LADRCVVFDEEHHIVAEGAPAEMLADTALLLAVNLIHDHSHVHLVEDPDGRLREVMHTHTHAEGHHTV